MSEDRSRIRGALPSALSRARFLCVAVTILGGAPVIAGEAVQGEPVRAREVSALAGHDAEAKMRDPADESRRDLLFFRSAVHEIGEAGVDCGHRRARRPDTIAGTGAVLVAVDSVSGRVLLRRWVAPEATAPEATPDFAALSDEMRARVGASSARGAVTIEAVAFAWCR